LANHVDLLFSAKLPQRSSTHSERRAQPIPSLGIPAGIAAAAALISDG
jgi:hypothetical protein